MIFNTNIGEAEDTDLYNTGAGDYGAAGLTDAPVADYEGDIADGAAADSSGNGNDGTLIGRVTAATGPVAASSDAVATFTTSTLSAGTTPHSLTAVFSGSASNTVSEVVGPDCAGHRLDVLDERIRGGAIGKFRGCLAQQSGRHAGHQG